MGGGKGNGVGEYCLGEGQYFRLVDEHKVEGGLRSGGGCWACWTCKACWTCRACWACWARIAFIGIGGDIIVPSSKGGLDIDESGNG